MIVDVHGVPIEFVITPGSVANIRSLSIFTIDLPDHSVLYADKTYTHYWGLNPPNSYVSA